MKHRSVLVIALTMAALVVPMSARAINLPNIPWLNNLNIPALPLPDLGLCVGTGCPVQFTNMTFILEMQRYEALLQDFRNIRNLGELQGAVQQVVGMVNVANAAPPVLRGSAAAQNVVATVPHTADRIAAIDAQAAAADGVQQQAQAANAYASVTAANTAQLAALTALQQKQNQANLDELSANLLTLTGGDLPADGL